MPQLGGRKTWVGVSDSNRKPSPLEIDCDCEVTVFGVWVSSLGTPIVPVSRNMSWDLRMKNGTITQWVLSLLLLSS